MASQSTESYKLLELSEHSESDLNLPELITTPRKKKVRRKKKSRSRSVSTDQPTFACNIRVVTIWIAAVLLTTWIITLTWLAIVLHNELQRLDSTVKGVIASNQGVPVELQECHTKTKSLEGNQTLILSQIVTLKSQLENFTKEMSDMQSGLSKLQEKFNNVPEYVNVPQNLKDMSESIANLGSQIKDITTTVVTLKDSKEKLETTSNTLVQNVTDLRQSMLRLENQTQVPVTNNSEKNAEIGNLLKVIDDIKNNITTINSTLSNNVQWIRDDVKKSNKNIENISNNGQNVSARITTLEGICGKTSSDQINLNTTVKNFYEEFKTLSTQFQGHTTSEASDFQRLRLDFQQLNQSTNDLLATVHLLSSTPNTPTPLDTVDALHERELPNTNKLKNENNPSSTTKSSASTAPPSAAKDENPTLKPTILST